MRSSLQVAIEQQREINKTLKLPLLAQIAKIYNLSVRDIAEIVGISKSHAADVLNHQAMPSLDVALKVARYLEVTVEDLWGWQVDDDGARRPLVVEIQKTKVLMRLQTKDQCYGTMELVRLLAESFKEGKDYV